MNYQDTIPFDAITQFYLKDVVEQMPLALQKPAIDLKVLRRGTAKQQINTLKDLYPDAYLFLPWILNDIFNLPAEVLWGIGRAHVLLTISSVMLDQLVDGQLVNTPAVPLIQQQLMLKGSKLLGSYIESPELFWGQYYAYLTEFNESLAIEWGCVRQHTQPYTYEMMQRVCTGKAAPMRIIAYTLALSSNNMQPLTILNPAFNQFLLADQLSDDALDWCEDFQAGRYTLPVVMALQATGKTLEAVSGLEIEDLETCLEQNGILVDMIEQAITLLENTRTSLREAGLGRSKWYAFLEKRLEIMRRQCRYLYASQFFGRLSVSTSYKAT